jgi:hypothetical protein
MDQAECNRQKLVSISLGDLIKLEPKIVRVDRISKPCLWKPIKVVTWNEDLSFFYSGLYTEITSGIVVKKHMYTIWHGKLFQGVEIMTSEGSAMLNINDFKNVKIA